MSLTGFDSGGSATINGLITMNANIMNTDELFIDASTTPINVGDALDAITVDVTILEGQMVTANSNISTLQGQVSTLDGEVNTLQSEMNTAQADIIALYSTTATTAATVAGLVISQAAQDVTIASHTVSIAALQLEDISLDNRIDALEVKTSDQSWGSLTGTTFSTKVNVGGGSGVVLNTSAASEFASGIVCSTMTSTAATTNMVIGSNLTTGTMDIDTGATTTGAINIGTGAAAKTITLGSSTVGTTTIRGQFAQLRPSVSGTSSVGDNQSSGTIQIGRGDANASTTTINIGTGSIITSAINVGTGAAAKTISVGSAASTVNVTGTTTIAGTTNINTTTLTNTTIGNGPAAGNITLNGAINAITGTTNINTTGTANTTIGNTGNTTINAGVLNLNGTAGITIDGGVSTLTMTADEDITISTATALGDIFISSDANSTFTSVAQTTINSVALDINATGAITIDTTDNMTLQADGIAINALVAGNQLQATTSTLIQSGTTTTLTSTGETEINCAAFDLNATGALTANSDGGMTFTEATGNVDIRSINADVIIRGDQLLITTDTTTQKAIIHTSATNVDDYSGVNALNGYGFRASNTGANTGGLEIVGYDTGISSIQSVGAAHSLNVVAGKDLGLTATAGLVSIVSGTTMDLASGTTMDLASGSTLTIDSATNRTTATTNIALQIGGNTRIDIVDATVTINPTTTILNRISGVTKQTITSTLITNTVPTVNSGLTYPITTTTALGYFLSTTTATKGTVAALNLASLAIPAAGCWFVEACFAWSGTGTAQAYTAIGLSTASAGFDGKRQQTFYQGGAAGGYGNNIQSIFNFTAAGTVYFVMQVPTAVGATTVQDNYLAITRIA